MPAPDWPDRCRLLDLEVRGDKRGNLVAVEAGRTIPFAIRRVYYIYATLGGVTRGCHAHRQLNQLCIPVRGGLTMLVDDGARRAELRLDDPARGLLIGPMIWREMRDFTPDCVLMVLADTVYDEADYIRDYDRFRAEVLAAGG